MGDHVYPNLLPVVSAKDCDCICGVCKYAKQHGRQHYHGFGGCWLAAM